MDKYDFLIVGSGLFGATFAFKAKQFNSRFWIIWCNVRIQSQTIRKKMFGD